MLAVLCSLVSLTCSGPPDVPQCCGSYLYQPSFCMDKEKRCPAEPYMPQPGDIILRVDNSLLMFWRVTHYLSLAFDPNGSAIVFARPDGSLATLEAGANNTLRVWTLDTLPHLKEYASTSRVWVRQRRVPLTPEQSCRLTAFALAQDGKRFAIGRLGVQMTPFRARGPHRTKFMAKPKGERRAYFCSELVCEACIAAGLLDPERTRPAATYPYDLFYGRSLNKFIDQHLDINCDWCPPARWTDCP
jgi:hypothetical protein